MRLLFSNITPALSNYYLLQQQYFVVLEGLVAAGDDTLAGLQTLEHLVVLWVLATDADVAAIGFLPALVKDKDLLAAGGLEEGATRDEHRLLGLAQFEVNIVGLARTDVFRALASEDKVAAELTLTHLRIDFAYLQLILLVATGKGGGEALTHTVDVMLVDLCLYLIVREIVQLDRKSVV